jgi:FtsP/CotA-like multicopper oxidase with cupredoxin domain
VKQPTHADRTLMSKQSVAVVRAHDRRNLTCIGYSSLFSALLLLAALPIEAESFAVQCPTSTITHPDPGNTGVNNSEPAYTVPTTLAPGAGGYLVPSANVNGAIKCQQISGGDGYATMGDGTQTYLFAFGPLSGLADIANGQPGTQFPIVFNSAYPGTLAPGDPATTGLAMFNNYNGAVGLAGDQEVFLSTTATATAAIDITGKITAVTVTDPGNWYFVAPAVTFSAPATGTTAVGHAVLTDGGVSSIVIDNAGTGYATPPTVTIDAASNACVGGRPPAPCLDGHVDPRPIMDVGVMNGNLPAPLIAIDEDDEFFLTLTNVGMIMRPDLFERHTVHFHGYPNASAFYDGVPDASVAINIAASFTYYYLAPDAGTYFWHCHITPPEHLQMGMVGQLYVRPRQNRVPQGTDLGVALKHQQNDLRTKCDSSSDILCSNPLPAAADGTTGATGVQHVAGKKYAYNDGDGSTAYDVEYPIQIHGFDPNFHFVGMTFNPENFKGMKDKYFLLNGRSYPDTVTTGPLSTQSADGVNHFSQPLPTIINIPAGQKALLRISDLDVSEYQTLASAIPMQVVGVNAKLLRDQAGNNLYYKTNSITLGGGESVDVILDSTGIPTGTYYLYTPNLDHLSNDAENFGGLMTEIHIL